MLRVYDQDALAGGELDVQDPFYGGADGFVRVLDQVERAADGLVEALRRELREEVRGD
jgi:protein-tyrosine phosphatase